jgi:hypothetical protein
MEPSVPLDLRAGIVSRTSDPGEVPGVPESVALSWLRPRLMCSPDDADEVGRLVLEALRRKMWTVSVVDETQRSVELRLNDIL